MKNKLILSLYILILQLSGSFVNEVFSQRNCGSTQQYLESIQKQYPQDSIYFKKYNKEITTPNTTPPPNVMMSSHLVTIPVVFHVVYNTSQQNISETRIQQQLARLNADFTATNTDYSLIPAEFQGVSGNPQIEFCLAQRDPSGNATNGITRTMTSRTSFPPVSDPIFFDSQGGKNIWDPSKYLNIYVCNINGDVLGWANFPGVPSTNYKDGVVIDYEYLGNTSGPYNLGRTATHEVGHWLNLRHIWGDAVCGNDFVSDTPVHYVNNGGCPSHPLVSDCPPTHNEMFQNYMDYTNDACMFMFTDGQVARMTATINGYRASLKTSNGCQAPSGGGGTCETPTNVAVSNIQTTSATITWNAVSGASSYLFEIKPQSSSTWTTQTYLGTSANRTGLTPNTTYDVRVRANCSSSNSSYSTVINFTTTASSCGVPSNLAVSSIQTTSVVCSWTAVSGAVNYTVEHKLSSSSTWTSQSTASTSITISGLTPNSAYNVRVRANCSGISSNFSSTVNFTTAQTICPDNYEPNNTKGTATTLTLATNITARIGSATDVDWFKFNTNNPQKNVRVTLTNLPADYTMELYKGTRLVGASANTGTANETIIFNDTETPTTFYVKIFSKSGAFSSNCYTIQGQISSVVFSSALILQSLKSNYIHVISEEGDPWEYRYNKITTRWETREYPRIEIWIDVNPNTSDKNKKELYKISDIYIRRRYDKITKK